MRHKGELARRHALDQIGVLQRLEAHDARDGAQEAAPEVVDHVVGGRHLHREEDPADRGAKGSDDTHGACGAQHSTLALVVVVDDLVKGRKLHQEHRQGRREVHHGTLPPDEVARRERRHEADELGHERTRREVTRQPEARENGLRRHQGQLQHSSETVKGGLMGRRA